MIKTRYNFMLKINILKQYSVSRGIGPDVMIPDGSRYYGCVELYSLKVVFKVISARGHEIEGST